MTARLPSPPPGYRPARRLLAVPDYRHYEYWKQAWLANHPKATPEEYTAAMCAIARECGV